jgi:purine-binding chemotaxis protein CheW
MPGGVQSVLVARVGESRFGLSIVAVQEIAPRVAVTALPGAPAVVLGLVRCRGELAVAVDLRARFGLPAAKASMDDHFVVARTKRRLVVLIVDRVEEVRAISEADVRSAPVSSPHVRGVVELPDGLVLLQDVDAVFSLDEERAIDEALRASA